MEENVQAATFTPRQCAPAARGFVVVSVLSSPTHTVIIHGEHACRKLCEGVYLRQFYKAGALPGRSSKPLRGLPWVCLGPGKSLADGSFQVS